MIDIHSHFLPNIDDGAKDTAEAIKMLSDSYADGCNMVVATPHCRVYSEKELENAINKRNEAKEELMEALENEKVEVPRILMGFEVYLDKDITMIQGFEQLCIEGADCMLVEMPMTNWDNFTLSRLSELKNVGITPIVAHIDRYRKNKRNIDKILNIEGICYQINADSFLSISGRRFIKKLLSQNKRMVAGSDMHNNKERKSHLKKAFEKASEMDIRLETMFILTPKEIPESI